MLVLTDSTLDRISHWSTPVKRRQVPARYLSNISFIESLPGEILAEVNSQLATARYTIAKPGES